MKRYFLILVCLLNIVDGRSQQAIEYSFEKYYYAQEGKKIASLKMWLTDQKYLDDLTGDAGGIAIKVDYSFLEKATKIKRGNTIEYLMHIIGMDMPAIALAFDMNVTKGTILTFESIDGKIESVYDDRDNTKSKVMTNFTAQASKLISNEMIIRLKINKSDLDSIKLSYFALNVINIKIDKHYINKSVGIRIHRIEMLLLKLSNLKNYIISVMLITFLDFAGYKFEG